MVREEVVDWIGLYAETFFSKRKDDPMQFSPSRVSDVSYLMRYAAVLAFGVAVALGAQAQDKTTVRILVGFAAGGSLDTTARILAEGMGQALNQAFIVENRPAPVA